MDLILFWPLQNKFLLGILVTNTYTKLVYANVQNTRASALENITRRQYWKVYNIQIYSKEKRLLKDSILK